MNERCNICHRQPDDHEDMDHPFETRAAAREAAAEREFYDEWWSAAEAEALERLTEMEEKYPGLDFELDDNGDVVCTTIPN